MNIIKPRDVQTILINEDTTLVRSRTWDRLKFEIEYARQRGTTANSYLIQGDKIALLDPPGESFTNIFLSNLQSRLDLTKLDYVILGHSNPNRMATLKELLKIAPQVTIVCSNPAAINLRAAFEGQKLQILVVKGEEDLDLGQGHNLQFTLTPNPRYPDSICTYDPRTKILYTDKLFSAHVCGDQVFDEGFSVFEDDRRYYFDCVIAPQARQVESALDRLKDFEVEVYAPAHGPLVKYALQTLTQEYRQWIKQQQTQDLQVALIYASAYGNTATVGQAIARGITKSGVRVETIDSEIVEPGEIQAIVEKSDGFVIGSPTLGGHAPTPIQTALGLVLSTANKAKLAGVFGSYGWSGEAIDLIEGKLKDAGFSLGFDTIRVKFKPTEVTLQTCEEAGTDFAQALKKAKKTRTSRQSGLGNQGDRTEQAVGRIVGSLCVVTTTQGDVSGAMLASWVSQATFTPPGLTLAVAKDRAIESMMYPGGQFVLNILAQGNHLGLMKHFLKPFNPGEDRFAGVSTEKAENGCPILTDGLAYVECSVLNRMECGDHWVIYAEVNNGKLLSDGLTAVHQRKSGSHY
ncbi:diflavin flavoprotein [Merismopedia glauca]|uniref:Flavin oxidoreductase n=1 Tax=Merismopedia glauca CCAP 1448/3 TaxID=1296344 RepID=A0A2T1C9X1_9CYAN|nr:diflavin flavoprotein [Merismopedia glauca]PSB05039.1 flavin oxidoreductase [Merismopedia glauca CCAP 1448/3]